jgi:HSP20 family protein
MANIDVRKSQQPQQQIERREREWEPARLMRSLLGFDPFREMAPFALERDLGFAPAFEVKETKDNYLFKADLPGVKQDDVEISYTGNRLTITGKREAEKEEKNETVYTYERSYGTFSRSFTLPEGIDSGKINADLRDGVLTVNVPKTPEAQPKKITVSGGSPEKKEPRH